MEDQAGRTGRKPKKYYMNYQPKDQRGHKPRQIGGTLQSHFKTTPEASSGLRGFLITSTSFNEIKCYLEMREILQSYHDQLYGEDEVQPTPSKNDCDCIEDEIQAELGKLKLMRPFKQVRTQCKQVIFITIQPEFANVDPIAIVDKFFDDIVQQKELKTFKTFKLYPVITTFSSKPSAAKTAVIEFLKSVADDGQEQKFFIELQSRGNFKLDQDSKQKIIEAAADGVTNIRPKWIVSRTDADLIISITALKNICCLSVLKQYFDRCKYNVVELSKKIGINISESNDDIEKNT